jgi:hypothetical protein
MPATASTSAVAAPLLRAPVARTSHLSETDGAATRVGDGTVEAGDLLAQPWQPPAK